MKKLIVLLWILIGLLYPEIVNAQRWIFLERVYCGDVVRYFYYSETNRKEQENLLIDITRIVIDNDTLFATHNKLSPDYRVIYPDEYLVCYGTWKYFDLYYIETNSFNVYIGCIIYPREITVVNKKHERQTVFKPRSK